VGGLTGFVIMGVAIAAFAGLSFAARRRISRMTNDQLVSQWIIDPVTGQRVPKAEPASGPSS